MSASSPRTSRRLGSPFDVRPGEGSPLLLLFLQAFFLGLAFVFFETPVNTLFLTQFGPTDLPLVYLLTAAVSVLAGLIYTRLEQILPAPKLFCRTAAGLSLSVAACYLAQNHATLPWLPKAMMAWKEVLWLLSNLVLWSAAGLVFDSRQSKRLFGVIAAGQVLATILGGLAVPLLIRWLGTNGLLLASGLAQWIWLGLLSRVLANHLPETSPESDPPETAKSQESARSMLSDPYVVLLFFSGIASFASYYLVDFLFYQQVHRSFQSPDQLASFFGEFYAVLGCVNLVTSAFVTAPLLTRFGLGTGLLLLPLVTALGTTVALTGGPRVFAAALVTKLLDEVLRSSVERSTLRVLLQPLALALRLRVQAWRESLMQPVSVGLTALLLLLLTRVLQVPDTTLMLLLLVVLAVWIWTCRELRTRYTARLTRALERRSFPLEELDFDNPALVDLLDQALESHQPADVIYSLTLMERMSVPTLPLLLEEALEHPSDAVRCHALGRIEALEILDLVPALEKYLGQETDPTLLGQILPVLCLLRPEDGVELVAPFLGNPHPLVRQGAMIGLLKNGGIDGVLVAGNHLRRLASSDLAEDRVFAAEILGKVSQPRFFRPLLPLLEDPDRKVRRTALLAAGRLANPRLIPHLVSNLDSPGLGDAASLALTRIGEPAFPALEEATRKHGRDSALCRRALGILGHLPGSRAQDLLIDFLDSPSPAPRHRALRALVDGKAQLSSQERLQDLLQVELQEEAWNQSCFLGVEGEPHFHALRGALRAESRLRRERVVLLLALRYSRELVVKLVPRLLGASPAQRLHALEILDDLLDPRLRSMCFPLLDDLAPGDRLERLPLPDLPEKRPPGRWLHALLSGEAKGLGTWTHAAALDVARQRQETTVIEATRTYLGSRLPILRETALATLAVLDPKLAQEAATEALSDRAPEVHQLARGILQEANA